MNYKLFFVAVVLFTFCSPRLLHSQINITEIKTIDEKIVLKPVPYDSISNWINNVTEFSKYNTEGRKYIGLDIYLPPNYRKYQIRDKSWSNPKDRYEKFYLECSFFTLKPSIIKWNYDVTVGKVGEEIPHLIDSIYTYVYKPIHYHAEYKDNKEGKMIGERKGKGYVDVQIFNDSAEISNKYFTIIDFLFGEKFKIIEDSMRVRDRRNYKFTSFLESSQIISEQRIYKKPFFDRLYPTCGFLLKSKDSGDSLICIGRDLNSLKLKFILVPYFLKQKELYQNKYLIYSPYASNYDFSASDRRYSSTVKDDNGKDITTYKKVTVSSKSKWICKEVALIKGFNEYGNYDNSSKEYNIRYILMNTNDEQIVVSDNIHDFMFETIYLKSEEESKLQAKQIEEKKRKEQLDWTENQRARIENFKNDCIKKFGQKNGEIIAQGKVAIGMDKDMCRAAWGTPMRSTKITTENNIIETWYFGLGYSLYFENSILKIITE